MEPKNVSYKIAAGKLYIVVDLTQDFGPSSTGKTTIIGTSSGNVALGEAAPGVMFGLNVFKKTPGGA